MKFFFNEFLNQNIRRDIGDELRHEAAGGSGNGGNEDIDQSGAVLAGGHAARVTHEGVLREERNQAAVLRNTLLVEC